MKLFYSMVAGIAAFVILCCWRFPEEVYVHLFIGFVGFATCVWLQTTMPPGMPRQNKRKIVLEDPPKKVCQGCLQEGEIGNDLFMGACLNSTSGPWTNSREDKLWHLDCYNEWHKLSVKKPKIIKLSKHRSIYADWEVSENKDHF